MAPCNGRASKGAPAQVSIVQAFLENMEHCLSNDVPFFGGDWQSYNSEALKLTMWSLCIPDKREMLLQQLQTKTTLQDVAAVLQTLPQVTETICIFLI